MAAARTTETRTPEASATPTATPCVNRARLVSSSPDQVQGGALKAGTIYRLYAEIQNIGTCVWENYGLVSIGDSDPFLYLLPVIRPGETQRILLTEGKAAYSLHYRLVMIDNNARTFEFAIGGWQGQVIWNMESYVDTTQVYRMPDGSTIICEGGT